MAHTPIRSVIDDFMGKVGSDEIEIYNEFSLQHELGIELRQAYKHLKVQYERNVAYFGFDKRKFLKREIDIAAFSADKEKLHFAIELKFPRQGQYPEQMFSFCKDIAFLEQLKSAGFQQCVFVAVVDAQPFYRGSDNGIYRYFRGGKPLHGTITKPTGQKDQSMTIKGSYAIKWQTIRGPLRYAVVTAGTR